MCEASSLLSLTSNLVEDIEASGWQQLVHIEGVVVNQVETESGQRGLFAALKCLGSHLARKLIQFRSEALPTSDYLSLSRYSRITFLILVENDIIGV